MSYLPAHQSVREEFQKCMGRDRTYENPDIGEIILNKPIDNYLEVSYGRL
jgi:hypothetical protein